MLSSELLCCIIKISFLHHAVVSLSDLESTLLVYAYLHISMCLTLASDVQVLNGNPYNRKCDVYSFGICLWEIYCCDMPYPDLSFSEVTSAVVRQVKQPAPSLPFSCLNFQLPKSEQVDIAMSFGEQNLRPDIPRCCPSSLANVMKRCWDANPDKRPEMAEVVSMLEAIDTSKGGGMIPVDQRPGCLSCFRQYRGP